MSPSYCVIIINEPFWSIYYDIQCIYLISFNNCIIAFYLLRKNVILSLEFFQCYSRRDQAVVGSETLYLFFKFFLNKVLMHFKILVVLAFTYIYIYIYIHFGKATNLYRLFRIIFYWSKASFMVYLKNYIFIAESCCCMQYIKHVADPP